MPPMFSLPPVNFSGRWLLDPSVSDSLGPLMAYHGLTDEQLLAQAENIRPTLVIQHNANTIRTSIFTDSPTASGTEEYSIDGRWHTQTLSRGAVQSRCYIAPHGQSIIVDTRCKNQYDLERSERFCLEDGQLMVFEIRILTCDPSRSVRENVFVKSKNSKLSNTGVATPFNNVFNKPVVAGNKVIVNELLFCKRVFRRVPGEENPMESKKREETIRQAVKEREQYHTAQVAPTHPSPSSPRLSSSPPPGLFRLLVSFLYPSSAPSSDAVRWMKLLDWGAIVVVVAVVVIARYYKAGADTK